MKVDGVSVLCVKKLDPRASLPLCAHQGEDLGFDLFALETTILLPGRVARVRTGIAVEMADFGFLVLGRSSLAMLGITVSGGVIDMGYRGEMFVNLTWAGFSGGAVYDVVTESGMCRKSENGFKVCAGDKIAQLVPVAPHTSGKVFEVNNLAAGTRGVAGYGSTGR